MLMKTIGNETMETMGNQWKSMELVRNTWKLTKNKETTIAGSLKIIAKSLKTIETTMNTIKKYDEINWQTPGQPKQ